MDVDHLEKTGRNAHREHWRVLKKIKTLASCTLCCPNAFILLQEQYYGNQHGLPSLKLIYFLSKYVVLPRSCLFFFLKHPNKRKIIFHYFIVTSFLISRAWTTIFENRECETDAVINLFFKTIGNHMCAHRLIRTCTLSSFPYVYYFTTSIFSWS